MGDSFLFLGTGSSVGVPVIGCRCGICMSKDPKNQRLRSSGVLHIGGKTIIIDVGPDFRTQALKHGIDQIDGVIITHCHFDHIAGFDDLRAYYFQKDMKLSCLASKESYEELKVRYHYLLDLDKGQHFSFQILPSDFGKVEFLGVELGIVTFFQKGMKVNGIRIGSFAYISDIREYSKEIADALRGVELLVVSAIGKEKTPMHWGFAEAIDFSREIGAKKTYFTHLEHTVDHEKNAREIPEGFHLAYDGLELPL